MDWVGVAGVIISLIAAFAALIRSYSENLGEVRAWRKMVEDQLDHHAAHHKEHYRHMTNSDVHWTERERDAQSKQLERIEELIKDLLKPRSDRSTWHFPDTTVK